MKKFLYIFFVFFTYLVALFIYFCIDLYYFPRVSVNVIIDQNLLDNAPASVNPRKEIDHYLDFAFGYFLKNFNIKFKVKDVSVIPMEKNHKFEYKDFKPNNERLTIVFQYSSVSDYAISTGYYSHTNMLFSFHDYSNEAQKWILVHEICHQFNVLDRDEDQSIMDGSCLMTTKSIILDGTNAIAQVIKETSPGLEMHLDQKSCEIIDGSKRNYAKGMTGFDDYPPILAQKIIDCYESVMPTVKYKGDAYFNMANYYYKHKDYERSLKYAKASVPIDNCIDSKVYANFVGRISLDMKYALLGNVYSAMGKLDMQVGSMEKSLAVNDSNIEYWKLLSSLYLKQIPRELWTGETIDKTKKALEKLIELDPKDTNPYLFLGMIYTGQKNQEKMKEYFLKFFSMHPTIGKVQKKDGYVSLKIEDVTDTEHLEKEVQPGGVTKKISLQYEDL